MSTLESMSLLGGVAPPLSTASSTATQETPSSFKWNGRTVGLAVGTGVLVITCVALAVLLHNPLILTAIPVILGGAWALMGSPSINDLLGGSSATTPEGQPLSPPRNSSNYGSVITDSNTTTAKTNNLRPNLPLPLDQTYQIDLKSRAENLLRRIHSGSNLGIDIVQLNSYILGYPTSADEFLGCALELYSKQMKLVQPNTTPLEQLHSIAHNIRLADDMIMIAPQNSEIARRFTTIKQDLESQRTSVLNSLEASRAAEVESLRNTVDQSAKHLGQNIFPGQLSGYSAGYTLAGEVSAVLEGTSVEKIKEDHQSASQRITTIDGAIAKNQSEIQQSELEVAGLERELQAQMCLVQVPVQGLIDSLPFHSTPVVERDKHSREIIRINQEIEANRVAVSKADTRAKLLPLIKERYQLELNLLTCEYRYETMKAHILLTAPENRQHLNQQIEKLGLISHRLKRLETNAQNLSSEIKRFQEADRTENDRGKEIARKNIARLMADPYTIDLIQFETSDEFRDPIVHSLYNDVLKKGWVASKTSLGEHLESIDYLPEQIREISKTTSEVQATQQTFESVSASLENLLSRINSEKEKLSSAFSTISRLEHDLTSEKKKLSEAEKKQKAVDKALGDLTTHVATVCSTPSFNRFVVEYKQYAQTAGIPRQQWAGEILEKLTAHFPQFNQFPQLKEPVLTALQTNGIDTTPILSGSSISATTTGNNRASSSSSSLSPFVAMMSSIPTEPTFDDQVEWIRKFDSIKAELVETIPKSSSSSTSKYAPYDREELEDFQEFLNEKLTDLRQITPEGNPNFAAQVTQTEEMVRAELSAVNSELEKWIR
ncbi:MAG: hypothetical protein JSR39_07075 [Verrucomicrobia bacterium]|nr:hypothetical protein [Verrucomicrobiota bacterium]